MPSVLAQHWGAVYMAVAEEHKISLTSLEIFFYKLFTHTAACAAVLT